MTGIVERAAALIESERAVPLSLRTGAARDGCAIEGATAMALEWTSRGDRVPAMLWRPDGDASARVAVLQYGAGEAIDAVHRSAVAVLVGAGLTVLTVDWPLHGERASVKLGERLLGALDANGPDPNGASLVAHLVLQSALDVSRALDAAATFAGLETRPVALVGAGLGAQLLALVAAVEARPSALVLAPGPRGTAATGLDLPALLAAGSPRPTLLVTGDARPATADEEIEILRRACSGDATVQRVGGGVDRLDAEVARESAAFLAKALA